MEPRHVADRTHIKDPRTQTKQTNTSRIFRLGSPPRLSDCHNDDVKHVAMEMVVLMEEPMLLKVNIKVMVIVIRRAMMATVLMMKVLLMAPIRP